MQVASMMEKKKSTEQREERGEKKKKRKQNDAAAGVMRRRYRLIRLRSQKQQPKKKIRTNLHCLNSLHWPRRPSQRRSLIEGPALPLPRSGRR